MIIRGPRPQRDFTILDNEPINDDQLSFRALGLLTFLLSKPDGWRVNALDLSKGEGREGREALRTALAELQKRGYMVRTRYQDDRGWWITETTVYDTAQPVNSEQNPCSEGPAKTCHTPPMELSTTEQTSSPESADKSPAQNPSFDKTPGRTEDGLLGVGAPGLGLLGAIERTVVSTESNNPNSPKGLLDSDLKDENPPPFSNLPHTWPSRTFAIVNVDCPNCNALKGQNCNGRSGPRMTNHKERLEAALPLYATFLGEKGKQIVPARSKDCKSCDGHGVLLQADNSALQCPDCLTQIEKAI